MIVKEAREQETRAAQVPRPMAPETSRKTNNHHWRNNSSGLTGPTPPCRLRGDRSKPVWGRFHCCRGTPRSISLPLIDNVLQGFALLKPAILLQKEVHRLILPVGRVVRAVRRQQNILQLVQQMSRR